MASLLAARGVAPDRILEEPTGRDTLSSALACVALLRACGHDGPVWAASNAYHLPRCRMLLRLAGVQAGAIAPEGPAARDWRRRWFWRLREVPALPWSVARMLWVQLARRRPGTSPSFSDKEKKEKHALLAFMKEKEGSGGVHLPRPH